MPKPRIRLDDHLKMIVSLITKPDDKYRKIDAMDDEMYNIFNKTSEMVTALLCFGPSNSWLAESLFCRTPYKKKLFFFPSERGLSIKEIIASRAILSSMLWRATLHQRGAILMIPQIKVWRNGFFRLSVVERVLVKYTL